MRPRDTGRQVTTPGGSTTDRVEILDLVSRFNRAADAGYPHELADTFVNDGVFEGIRGTARGRDELMAFVVALHQPQDPPHGVQHLTHNLVVDFLDPDTAIMTSDLLMIAVHVDGPRITFAGRYRDDLVRTSVGWRFAHRRVTRIGPISGPGEKADQVATD